MSFLHTNCYRHAVLVCTYKYDIQAPLPTNCSTVTCSNRVIIIENISFVILNRHSPSYSGGETPKISFGFRVKLPPAHRSTCPPVNLLTGQPHPQEASHCPFHCWKSSREAANTNFGGLRFDPRIESINNALSTRQSLSRFQFSTTHRYWSYHFKILIATTDWFTK